MTSSIENSKARYAQVGGGPDSFIGSVHRMAARLDNRCELVAGCFSSDQARSLRTGAELGLDLKRTFGSYNQLLAAEAQRPQHERAEFINIVTPNHLHAPVAKAAIEFGFDVLCDKPLCHSAAEAAELSSQLASANSFYGKVAPLFGVTYNYSGYPMVREARHRVHSGSIGTVRHITVEYSQGWLAQQIETEQQKQASWRVDPERAGAGGALGDIGTHAAHLAEFVGGSKIARVLADLGTSFSSRVLDDNASVLLRFESGCRGLVCATQVAVGRENGLRLRVFGETGSLEWFQEEPNTLIVDALDRPRKIMRTGGPGLSQDAAAATRLPLGHPEGFIEAFANVFTDFADTVILRRQDLSATPQWTPSLEDGARGMRFIEAAVASSAAGQTWIDA